MTLNERNIVNAVKNILNSMPSACFWHDGHSDPTCHFQTMHLHVVVHTLSQSLHRGVYSMNRAQKVFREMEPYFPGLTVRSQKCRNFKGLLSYCLQPPRVFAGCNIQDMLDTIRHLEDPDSIEHQLHQPRNVLEEDWEEEEAQNTNARSSMETGGGEIGRILAAQAAQTRATTPTNTESPTFQQSIGTPTARPQGQVAITATARKTQVVIDMLLRYNAVTLDEVLERLLREEPLQTALLQQWRSIMTAPNVKMILGQALNEMNIMRNARGDTYVDTFIKANYEDMKCMTVQETASLFVHWCREQDIPPERLMLDIYLVLNKTLNKVNTLMLHGRSNAGKTYWANCLTPFPNKVGQTIPSADFAYQDCIGKEVIIIPEINLVKAEQVEEFKTITEGMKKKVNIKHRDPRFLDRTPIILSCNTKPWATYSQEEAGLRNRMISYEDLKESQVLKDVGDANPRFFANCFAFIKADLDKDIHFASNLQDDDFRSEVEGVILPFLMQQTQNYVSLEEYWADEMKEAQDRGQFAMLNLGVDLDRYLCLEPDRLDRYPINLINRDMQRVITLWMQWAGDYSWAWDFDNAVLLDHSLNKYKVKNMPAYIIQKLKYQKVRLIKVYKMYDRVLSSMTMVGSYLVKKSIHAIIQAISKMEEAYDQKSKRFAPKITSTSIKQTQQNTWMEDEIMSEWYPEEELPSDLRNLGIKVRHSPPTPPLSPIRKRSKPDMSGDAPEGASFCVPKVSEPFTSADTGSKTYFPHISEQDEEAGPSTVSDIYHSQTPSMSTEEARKKIEQALLNMSQGENRKRVEDQVQTYLLISQAQKTGNEAELTRLRHSRNEYAEPDVLDKHLEEELGYIWHDVKNYL
ncbi:uncharacterized protein LOC128243832 [Mya arenaria]|uniref:uncharacterized protein LOC128243832 n=1 Tax=Mya arenaria TaxID=6604 RepID=UPI0022E7A1EB|nr:uncharacterized protein LOC128243832 [Mya arenaria]